MRKRHSEFGPDPWMQEIYDELDMCVCAQYNCRERLLKNGKRIKTELYKHQGS